MTKHRYISDKDLYKAVMGACSWIKQDGCFNKATQYYANKHGVPIEDVRAEVRNRQKVGAKGKKRGSYSQYRYKGSYEYRRNERFFGAGDFDVTIKALKEINARRRLDEKVLGFKIDEFLDDVIYNFEIEGKVEL